MLVWCLFADVGFGVSVVIGTDDDDSDYGKQRKSGLEVRGPGSQVRLGRRAQRLDRLPRAEEHAVSQVSCSFFFISPHIFLLFFPGLLKNKMKSRALIERSLKNFWTPGNSRTARHYQQPRTIDPELTRQALLNNYKAAQGDFSIAANSRSGKLLPP